MHKAASLQLQSASVYATSCKTLTSESAVCSNICTSWIASFDVIQGPNSEDPFHPSALCSSIGNGKVHFSDLGLHMTFFNDQNLRDLCRTNWAKLVEFKIDHCAILKNQVVIGGADLGRRLWVRAEDGAIVFQVVAMGGTPCAMEEGPVRSRMDIATNTSSGLLRTAEPSATSPPASPGNLQPATPGARSDKTSPQKTNIAPKRQGGIYTFLAVDVKVPGQSPFTSSSNFALWLANLQGLNLHDISLYKSNLPEETDSETPKPALENIVGKVIFVPQDNVEIGVHSKYGRPGAVVVRAPHHLEIVIFKDRSRNPDIFKIVCLTKLEQEISFYEDCSIIKLEYIDQVQVNSGSQPGAAAAPDQPAGEKKKCVPSFKSSRPTKAVFKVYVLPDMVGQYAGFAAGDIAQQFADGMSSYYRNVESADKDEPRFYLHWPTPEEQQEALHLKYMDK